MLGGHRSRLGPLTALCVALAFAATCAGQAVTRTQHASPACAAARDLSEWQLLPESSNGSLTADDEVLLRRAAQIFRACHIVFLRPQRPEHGRLQALRAAAAQLAGGQRRSADPAAVQAGVRLRGMRDVWLPSPSTFPFDNQLLELFRAVGRVLELAWGRPVHLDFLTVLVVPPGAAAQRLHADSAGVFAKAQLALHNYTAEQGALSFLPPGAAMEDRHCFAQCSADGTSISASCGEKGSQVPLLGFPRRRVDAGDVALYLGSVLHAGLENRGGDWKLALDVSLRRGMPAHQQQQLQGQQQSLAGSDGLADSRFVRTSWDESTDNGALAHEWNRLRRQQWMGLFGP
mmetsp:Transcript_10579/g.27421  ORF Transcript_10579/g.27421 Transcript_10579/m.27421 type:complete len:346 (-) Transcript_10579:51-1088(-)